MVPGISDTHSRRHHCDTNCSHGAAATARWWSGLMQLGSAEMLSGQTERGQDLRTNVDLSSFATSSAAGRLTRNVSPA